MSNREPVNVRKGLAAVQGLEPPEGDVVESLTAEQCRAKALDCMIHAETLDDPRLKAAMLQYAEWWRRLAEYRGARERPLPSKADGENRR